MTSDGRGSQGQNQSSVKQIPGQQVALKIQQLDLNAAAAELSRRIDDINKSIASIEDAKVITQHLLQKEVSI